MYNKKKSNKDFYFWMGVGFGLAGLLFTNPYIFAISIYFLVKGA